MTGGLYPAIVQDELEKIKVPILPMSVQQQVVKAVQEGCQRIAIELEEAKRKAEQELRALDSLVLGVNQREDT